MIAFMEVFRSSHLCITKEFADLAITQINDWCSGKEGLQFQLSRTIKSRDRESG